MSDKKKRNNNNTNLIYTQDVYAILKMAPDDE